MNNSIFYLKQTINQSKIFRKKKFLELQNFLYKNHYEKMNLSKNAEK